MLAPGDEAALDAFFAAHSHTTLFFQNNVRKGGLVDRGVPRSVLFTEEDNHPAKAAYRALGYQRVGDYGMVMFGDGEAR